MFVTCLWCPKQSWDIFKYQQNAPKSQVLHQNHTLRTCLFVKSQADPLLEIGTQVHSTWNSACVACGEN